MAEWAELPEDVSGEWVSGRLEEEEVGNFLHDWLTVWLSTQISNWITPRGGLVGGSEGKYAVREDRGRKPDLAVYFPGRRPPFEASLIDVPPDIMAEVVSASPRDQRRDRVHKVDEYAAFGVRYYWIVDPHLRSFEVLDLGSDRRYVRALGATRGVVDRIPGCEGFRIDLDWLWSEIDRLCATPS